MTVPEEIKNIPAEKLVIDHVSKHFRTAGTTVKALEDISFQVAEGEFVCIVGPSGCGKTTLLNIIGCLDTPTSGRYLLEGKDVSTLKDRELTRIRLRRMGFIFQQFYLIPTLNASENVELPMKEAGVPRSKRKARLEELFGLIELKGHMRHFPNQLSGGQQQKVAIARALSNRPFIILADEPTGEIDSTAGERIVRLLKKLNRDEGITILMVTHNEDVARVASRIIRLKDGRIVG
jgi:putative ABC transport system ATP-binding protein